MKIPYNKHYSSGKELTYINQAILSNKISSGGNFTKKSVNILKRKLNCNDVLLTNTCTDALELSALLINIKPGDEIIMPSYTFVSTANAFVLRGAIPIFVDIRTDTLNIDENQIENSITNKTKAIIVVHYAGIACEMNKILKIARKYNLIVIEDAAHAIDASYYGKKLGTIGDIGTFSFHETKNISCGEGGAILINNNKFNFSAKIIAEKGTNRNDFLLKKIKKYTWETVGSSFLMSDIQAAYLYAQLQILSNITKSRLKIWNKYDLAFMLDEKLCTPVVPKNCIHNAHIYYILLPNNSVREKLLLKLKSKKIIASTHYVPLHNTPAGLLYGKKYSNLDNTEKIEKTILRLPLWIGIERYQDFIIDTVLNSI